MFRRRWGVLGIVGLVAAMLLIPAAARGAPNRDARVDTRGGGRAATISVVPASVRVRCGTGGLTGRASITVTAHAPRHHGSPHRAHPRIGVTWELAGARLGQATLTRFDEPTVITSDAVPCAAAAKAAAAPRQNGVTQQHEVKQQDDDEQECEDEDEGPFAESSSVHAAGSTLLQVQLHCVDDAS